MRAFSPFLKRIFFWASFIGITFLLLSSIGLLYGTKQTFDKFGWSYEQTVIIGDNSQIQTVRLMDQFIFAFWLVFLSVTQAIQLIYLRYLMNQSKD